MQKVLFLFLLISSNILLSQNIVEYNRILKTDSLLFNKSEIRVYKKYATSTGLEMFRLYQDHLNWVGEWYNTEATDNHSVKIKKSTIDSLKTTDLVWVKIIDTDILYLPHWENIQYKLEKKNKEYFTEDGEIVSSRSKSLIIDGVSYYVKIKNGQQENEFEYNNPESYLKIYPNVDELISFKDLLALLRNEFKIFQK